MKKLQIILVVLILLALFSSCEKSYFNPIESYYELNNPSKKWVFSSSSFGLDVRNPYLNIDTFYWIRCEKEGNFKKGTIEFDNTIGDAIEFTYAVSGNTVVLEGFNDMGQRFKYTLIYDRQKQNFPGIFQKK